MDKKIYGNGIITNASNDMPNDTLGNKSKIILTVAGSYWDKSDKSDKSEFEEMLLDPRFDIYFSINNFIEK